MNKSSLHSTGGTTVAVASIPAMPRSVFDASTEGDAPLQPVRRCPSNDNVDIVPQVPIRQESCSIHSQSLYDLDPRDSIPKPPRRKSSGPRPDSTHRRRRVRCKDEQSSCGSSLMSPPSSVLVPQDSSLWSAAISTLMSHEEEERGVARKPSPIEFEAALVPKEMLPWDRIAIGVVCEKGVGRASIERPLQSDIEFNAGILDDLESRDTMSYPSFHQILTSHGDSPSSGSYAYRRDLASTHERRASDSYLQSPVGGIPTKRASLPVDRFGSSPNTSPSAHSPLLQPCRTPSQERMIAGLDSSRHSTQRTLPSYRLDGLNTDFLVATPPFGNNTSTRRSVPSTTFRSQDVRPQRDKVPFLDRLDETHSSPPSTCPPLEDITIEIAPGIKLPLRGSEETWKAIEEGQATVTSCISCQQELHCVLDAQLVVCPDCTMLSPVDQTNHFSGTSADRYGVGLGIKPADVLRWIQRHM